MNKQTELEQYLFLTRKNQVNNEDHHKVMLAGLEAMLSCLNNNTDVDDVLNELYQYLGKNERTLNEYLEVIKQLEELNAPVTASEIQYVIAGIESIKNSQEFLNESDGKFDFLKLFKIFSKFAAEAAHLSTCNEDEIESKYPGLLSEDMESSTPEGKKISRKYKFLAKFFKILAKILVMRAYILNIVANTSNVLCKKIKNFYRSELESLKSLQKSIDRTIGNISKSIKEIKGKSNGILTTEYNKLVENRKELQTIYDQLKYQVKVEIISQSLHYKQEVFAPLFDPKNREVFAKLAESNLHHKQDQFTGLTGIINTRPDLSPLRNIMKEFCGTSINDVLIIAVFSYCLNICKEIATERQSFEDRLAGGTQEFGIGAAAA